MSLQGLPRTTDSWGSFYQLCTSPPPLPSPCTCSVGLFRFPRLLQIVRERETRSLCGPGASWRHLLLQCAAGPALGGGPGHTRASESVLDRGPGAGNGLAAAGSALGRWAMGVQGGEAKTEPPQPRLGSVHQLPAWRQQGDLHLRGVVNNYVTPPPSQNGEDASRLLQSGADICKGALLFCFGFSAMCVCAKQTLPLVKTMRDGRQPVEERRIFPLKVSSQESLRKYRGSICLFQKAPG